jgi:hypothetical protein
LSGAFDIHYSRPRRGTVAAVGPLARPTRTGPFPPVADDILPVITALSHREEAPVLFRIASIKPSDGGLASYGHDRAVPLDWDRMISVAMLENAMTLLHDWVSVLPVDALPAEARSRIRGLALVWEFKLRILEQRLIESVRVLSEAGIDALLLKGAALGVTAYGSFAGRPMADIDLLVPPSRAEEAHALMLRSGWEVAPATPRGNPWETHHHLLPLADARGSGLRLELHIAPLLPGHPFRLDSADILANARTVEIGGVWVRVPEPHLHAVHAAAHFAWSHRFESGGLNAFRDLAAMRAMGLLSWEELVEVARRTRTDAACYWTLRLARSMTELPVGDDILAALRPSLSERVLTVLERHFTHVILRDDSACPSVTIRNRLWALALQAGRYPRTDPFNWRLADAPNPEEPATPALAAIRRFGLHFRRAPRWSRYVASLLAPAPRLQSAWRGNGAAASTTEPRA